MKAEYYGMTEKDFLSMQEKHRKEAEAIKAGIKARKLRLRKIMRCGETALASSQAMETCTEEEAVRAVDMAMQQESVRVYLRELLKEGR